MGSFSLLTMVNRALATIGERPLVDISAQNTNPTCQVMLNMIPLVTRALLAEADWNCARKTVTLEAEELEEGETLLGYAFKFPLPKTPECLQVRQVSLDGGETFVLVNDYYNWNRGGPDTLFDIEDGYLLANVKDVVIKYTAVISPDRFDPLLAEAFSAKLAAEAAYNITASTSNADYLASIAQRKLRKALCRNALSRNIERYEGEVVGIRRYSSDREYIRNARRSSKEDTLNELNNEVDELETLVKEKEEELENIENGSY